MKQLTQVNNRSLAPIVTQNLNESIPWRYTWKIPVRKLLQKYKVKEIFKIINFDILQKEEDHTSSSDLNKQLSSENSAEKISEANIIKHVSDQHNIELQKKVPIDPLACMNSFMFLQIAKLWTSVVTMWALEWFLTCVDSFMYI